MTRILVVEDDPKVASMLQRGLAFEGYGVVVAGDGEQALRAARENPPDLMILDLMLPGIDGLEVARRVRRGSDVPLLMLTARDAVPDRVAGLEAGADDYLVKPFAFDELLARIKTILRRARPQAGELLRVGELELNTATRELRRGARPIVLTAREFELLELFMRHPRQVFSREQLLSRIWGDEDYESNVVEAHMKRLREKLEAGGEPRVIQTLRGAGYALRTAADQ
jgi:two-component system, OmpR family, response regulator MprA